MFCSDTNPKLHRFNSWILETSTSSTEGNRISPIQLTYPGFPFRSCNTIPNLYTSSLWYPLNWFISPDLKSLTVSSRLPSQELEEESTEDINGGAVVGVPAKLSPLKIFLINF